MIHTETTIKTLHRTLLAVNNQDQTVRELRQELFNLAEQDAQFLETPLKVRELRHKLFNIKDQDQTIRELRYTLSVQPDQQKRVGFDF